MKLQHIARGAPPLTCSALFTLLLIGLSSCKDPLGSSKEHIPPEGKVLELGTNQPIPDAVVEVYGNCEGELLGNFECDLLETLTSNSSGYYQSTQEDAFEVYARKEGYFSDYDLSSTIITSGSEKQANIILTPFAWLRVTLKNESGLYGFGSSQILDPPSYWIHQEIGDSKTVVKQVKGNKEYKLIFYLLQDENTTTRDISTLVITGEGLGALPIDTSGAFDIKIVPVGHDTTDITIIY